MPGPNRRAPIYLVAQRRLSEIRLAQRVSTVELERRTGLHRSRIRYYENGTLLLTLPTLKRLADALGRPVAEFLGD